MFEKARITTLQEFSVTKIEDGLIYSVIPASSHNIRCSVGNDESSFRTAVAIEENSHKLPAQTKPVPANADWNKKLNAAREVLSSITDEQIDDESLGYLIGFLELVPEAGISIEKNGKTTKYNLACVKKPESELYYHDFFVSRECNPNISNEYRNLSYDLSSQISRRNYTKIKDIGVMLQKNDKEIKEFLAIYNEVEQQQDDVLELNNPDDIAKKRQEIAEKLRNSEQEKQ